MGSVNRIILVYNYGAITHCKYDDLMVPTSSIWKLPLGVGRLLEMTTMHSPLSKVLDHQMAAYVKEDFRSNFLYILIIFKWQIHKDDFLLVACERAA